MAGRDMTGTGRQSSADGASPAVDRQMVSTSANVFVISIIKRDNAMSPPCSTTGSFDSR